MDPMAKKPGKPMSKTEMLNALAEKTGHSKKEVGAIVEALEGLICHSVTKGSGVFALPGLLKVEVKVRPATKERMGRNPATGEPTLIKAKPAKKVVKVRALKKLKDLI
jgi:nucleoid DNA-binding protein